jgi:regulatory protein
VDDDTARAQLEAIDPEEERERARQLVDKKLRTMHGLDPAVQVRRLAGMLARKGYPGELAMSVVREALAGSPEHQRD